MDAKKARLRYVASTLRKEVVIQPTIAQQEMPLATESVRRATEELKEEPKTLPIESPVVSPLANVMFSKAQKTIQKIRESGLPIQPIDEIELVARNVQEYMLIVEHRRESTRADASVAQKIYRRLKK